ncbi:MAG: TIGR03084 family protein [Chloroflexi bacterium]|nr:TIGR03084 family protein [Chloroflexota bacterium]
MSSSLDQIVDDLEAEHAALAGVLDGLSAPDWDVATHNPGWSVRDQVSHLAYFDEAASRAISDQEAFQAEVRAAMKSGSDLEASYVERGRGMEPRAVLAWWRSASSALIAGARTADPKARLPWFGPDMSPASFITARLMETWSHGLDVVDVVDGDRPDTDRLRHVAFLGVRTRAYSYSVRRMKQPDTPIRVELTSPSGETWILGDPDAEESIRGTATDFCRVAAQRRHVADTDLEVIGDAAKEWMGIAQTFAGPPGGGRQPGEFPKEKRE